MNETSPSLFTSLQRLLATALHLAQKRLELFAVEMQEERGRWMQAALCAAGVVVFGALALTVLTFAIILLCWDHGRMIAVGSLLLAYLLGAVFSYLALRKKLTQGAPFTATLAEFKKDREWLNTRH